MYESFEFPYKFICIFLGLIDDMLALVNSLRPSDAFMRQ